ncbi:chromosomal replication initiator protein DnaA [Candidatus Obscuribacterales bacterium]|nr:chromosomal replication initiator protein DnaA [Candidatus Obscuribacterales bacterium]
MHTSDDVRYLKPVPQIWADALKQLSSTASPGVFAVLQTAVDLTKFTNGLAVVAVVNSFYQTLLLRHKQQIQEALEKVTGVPVKVDFVIDSSVAPAVYTGTFADLASETAAPSPFPQAGASPYSTGPKIPASHDSGFAQSSAAFSPSLNSTTQGYSQQELFKPTAVPVTPHTVPQVQTGGNVSIPQTNYAQNGFGSATGFQQQDLQAARTGASPQMGRLPANPVPRPSRPLDLTRSGLNPKYTFSTFVVGSNNSFCHSAALAVAQNPGNNYNPLFIYGGVGLGKTHLMQAIGHAILENNPNAQIRYLTCERFTNDLINSIKDKSTGEFRKRYRYNDVLLIDDIQFIEGKESTQEEFFHTFNALRDAGKQIILTSDRPPKAFSRLEERLRSRFEWGLISDIQAPDYETRLAILRKKCDLDGIVIDDSALNHIASLFTTNIRELEGALIRVNAYANLTGQKVDQHSLHTLLTPHGTPVSKPSLTVETIIKAVAEHYKLDPVDLKGKSRAGDLTTPRHIAMHLAHDLMSLSFPRIGQAFGNRKHTSAIYADNKVKELLVGDPAVAAAVSQIKRQLGN